MANVKPKVYIVKCAGCKRHFDFNDLYWFNSTPVCTGCLTFKDHKIDLSQNNIISFEKENKNMT